MRWPLLHLTLPFLVVHCSAPPHSNTFEEGSGGANSADTMSATSTTNGAGGSGAEPGTGGSSGDGSTLTANTSTSTSLGGTGGSADATVGTATGGGGAGGDSTTTATSGTGAAGGVGGDGGSASTGSGGASASSGGAGTSGGTSGGGTGGTSGGTGGIGGGTGGTGGTGGASCAPAEEVCDGADNDCNESVDEENVCPDGCVGASFASHSYLFCDRPRAGGPGSEARSWEQAMQYCTARGLNLTVIESEDENAFIYKTLVSLEVSGDVWMGATDEEDEGYWAWAVGESPDDWILFYDQDDEEPIDGAFNDWREGEPNDDGGEDCGIFEDLGSDEWAWDDRSCQAQYDLLVCESVD